MCSRFCRRAIGNDPLINVGDRIPQPFFGLVFGLCWSLLVALAWHAAYNNRMEISFAPELEARLNWIASQTGKGPDEVVRELVASYIDHDEWFRQEVGKGLASLDQGKTVSHEDVRRQMDRILGS